MSESRRCSPSFTRLKISSSVTRGAVTTYSGSAPEARRIVSSTASTGAACALGVLSPARSTSTTRARSRACAVISEHAEFEVLLGILLDVEQERVQPLEASRQLVVQLGIVEYAARAPLSRSRHPQERVHARRRALERLVEPRVGGQLAQRPVPPIHAPDERIDLHRHGTQSLRGLALAGIEIVREDGHLGRHTMQVVVEFPV